MNWDTSQTKTDRPLGHIKGLVHETGENATVKVRLPEYEDLITDWLPVAQSLTLGAKCYTVPRLDTQVIILPGYGLEDAVVIGAIYSKPDPAPFKDAAIIGMVADDGVEISYDPGKSLLKIQSPKEINIIATNINIQADIDIKGDITHTGDQDHTGAATHTGNTTQTGTLTNTATISSGIGLTTHKHSGVASGTSVSGAPIP